MSGMDNSRDGHVAVPPSIELPFARRKVDAPLKYSSF